MMNGVIPDMTVEGQETMMARIVGKIRNNLESHYSDGKLPRR